jgi:MFS family permease
MEQITRRSMGRWYVLILISLMYLITYLDRVNISTAAPVISKEFGFDKITMGVIFSAFGWAYAMFQVPGGWLGDRFGARNVLTVIVSYWSAMTAATAVAGGATSFMVLRFLFGMGEAGAFPGATRAMQLSRSGWCADPFRRVRSGWSADRPRGPSCLR